MSVRYFRDGEGKPRERRSRANGCGMDDLRFAHFHAKVLLADALFRAVYETEAPGHIPEEPRGSGHPTTLAAALFQRLYPL